MQAGKSTPRPRRPSHNWSSKLHTIKNNQMTPRRIRISLSILFLLLTMAVSAGAQSAPGISGLWKQDNDRCQPKRKADVTLRIAALPPGTHGRNIDLAQFGERAARGAEVHDRWDRLRVDRSRWRRVSHIGRLEGRESNLLNRGT
jgi:hypothetical protein